MTYDTAFYDTIAPGCRDSARVVVPLLMELFAPLSVVDIGCGEGHWLAEFAAAGCRIIGVDGRHIDPARLAFDPAHFRPADLTRPPERPDHHDLAISLEVGEHLPAWAAERYVKSLVQSAPVVVFSAAIPGQGGAGHVNEQWPAYWEALFRAHGYLGTGALRWAVWNDDRVENWYRQNLLVYAGAETIDRLSAGAQELWRGNHGLVLPVVHPVLWESRR